MKAKIKEKIKSYLKKKGYALVNLNDVNNKNNAELQKTLGGINIAENLDYIINTEKVPFSEEDFMKRDDSVYTVSWVIPPLGIGSGGHINIFRAIDHIGRQGIKSKVYIYGGNEGTATKDLRDFVQKYYGVDLKHNEIYPSVKMMDYSDAVIATSWITAYVVNNFDNAVSKFYFVQDFEPFFFAVGSNYYLAENTYKMGFRGITAGDWLKDKLRDEYKMETESFWFAYDKDLYKPYERKDNKNRIFFYARPYTERRAFEIGVLAFEVLAKRMPDVEILFMGQKLDDYKFAFNYVDKGIVDIRNLAEEYSQCDMCLVLSSTNLSLLPMEVMASNSVVVSNYGANNEWLLNEDNAILVECDPIKIADKLEYYLKNKEELAKYRENSKKYISNITWENELKKVSDFIKKSVDKDMGDLK